MEQTYFFDTDDSGHWYMVPTDKREEWERVNELDPEEAGSYEAFEPFNDYRINGGITDIEFVPVKLPEGMEE